MSWRPMAQRLDAEIRGSKILKTAAFLLLLLCMDKEAMTRRALLCGRCPMGLHLKIFPGLPLSLDIGRKAYLTM